MANNLLTNPIKIEAVMATSYKAAVASTLGTLFTLRVGQVRWINPGAATDEVLITDPVSGNELLHMKATAAGQDVVADWTADAHLWRDFIVIQLGSGRLEIFTR